MITKRTCLLLIAVVLVGLSSSNVVSNSTSDNIITPFVPATLIDVDVAPFASFEALMWAPAFTYKYKIISRPDSKQYVAEFDISTGTARVKITDIPQFWIGDDRAIIIGNSGRPMTLSWGAIGDVKAANVPFPDGKIPGSIPPGKSLDGFGMSSPALPGIETAYLRGDAPIPHVKWVDENSPKIPDPLDDAIKIKTVGPDVLPDNLSNEQLLDRLISLKEQAFQLGWINHKGVAHSLNKKLQAARKKLLKGEVKTAAHILHAFIHDLEAQHRKEKERDKEEDKEKHVNDHAFYLLKPNAEFILFRLGELEKGKGKEE